MALDLFLKIPNIPGESTDKQHPGEIVLLSYSIKQESFESVPTSELTVTKTIDSSTTPLIRAFYLGTHLVNMVLSVRQAGKNIDQLIITFFDVTIASQTMTATTTGGLPIEEYKFFYTKNKFEYAKVNKAGSLTSRSQVCWNYDTNSEC